jgi:hypothetical protein
MGNVAASGSQFGLDQGAGATRFTGGFQEYKFVADSRINADLAASSLRFGLSCQTTGSVRNQKHSAAP